MFCALLLYNVNSVLSDIYNHLWGGGGGGKGKLVFLGDSQKLQNVLSTSQGWKIPVLMLDGNFRYHFGVCLIARVIPIGLCYWISLNIHICNVFYSQLLRPKFIVCNLIITVTFVRVFKCEECCPKPNFIFVKKQLHANEIVISPPKN